MNSVARLVEELKRRHVFRVAVAYVVAGVAVLGAAEVILDPLGLANLRPGIVIVTILGLPLALVLAWAYDLTPDGVVRTTGAEAEGAETTAGSEPDGIVVLPFENLSPNPEDEYFSDGVTEDLIAQLHRFGWLRVISRASAWQYKTTRVGAKEIGAQLGVAYLLEGSVRRSGSRVRIMAQLIEARSDRHLWAETYDRELEDIFAIQSDVSARIATALRDRLPVPEGSPAAETLAGHEATLTSDLQAYDLYLRGRYLWDRRSATDVDESVTHLRTAVARDPEFIRARSALAEAYVTQAVYGFRPADEVLPLARREADQALARDPLEAPALSALACVRAIYDWEWSRAEAGFASAIKAKPQYPTAPQWLAMNVLVPLGRFDEAEAQLDRAHALDPMSPSVRSSLGVVEFYRGRYDGAIERFDALLEQDPDFQFAHLFGGLSRMYRGDTEKALESLRRASESGGWSPEIAAANGCALVANGQESAGRSVLEELYDRGRERYVSPVRTAQLHVALSEREKALDLLEQATRDRAADLIWVDVHPGFEPIRGDPRYLALRERVFEGFD